MSATNGMHRILERLRLLEEIVSEVVDDTLPIGTRMTISDEVYLQCLRLRNDATEYGRTLFCDRCHLRSGLCTCDDHRQGRNKADSGQISVSPASVDQIAALRAQISLLIAGQRYNGERIAALEGRDQ